MVRDLSSGSERAVWDGLDRDMQETWAIHGVYPHFAWTPSGTHVVIWANGVLNRVEMATGYHEVIPLSRPRYT